jgi:segregation and condensation protein B
MDEADVKTQEAEDATTERAGEQDALVPEEIRQVAEPRPAEAVGAPEPEQAAAIEPANEADGAEPANSDPAAAEPASAPEQLGLEAKAADEDAAATELRALIEAIVYVTDEPVTPAQIAAALNTPEDKVRAALAALTELYNTPEHGLTIREVAGGYKMATKPEHHEGIRAFAKSLKPPLKLSLAALETLATIAYKQPITAPEIMEIRGVQGAGVLKTLLDRKLIQAAGRKNVVGRPILYKTSKDFLVQFGLKDLSELPTLKEFEELRRLAVGEEAAAEEAPAPVEAAPTEPEEAAKPAPEEIAAADPVAAPEEPNPENA